MACGWDGWISHSRAFGAWRYLLLMGANWWSEGLGKDESLPTGTLGRTQDGGRKIEQCGVQFREVFSKLEDLSECWRTLMPH